MSELKAFDIVVAEEGYCEGVVKYRRAVYDKSEADKVIAELEEKLKYSRNARKYWRKEYLIEYKECCHQKYRRCLAMARWCWAVKELNRYGDQDYMDFAEKWHNRWLELAEKFKPNKEA